MENVIVLFKSPVLPKLVVIAFAVLISCKSSQQNANNEENMVNLVEEELGGQAEFYPNSDESFILCKRIDEGKNKLVNFLVYDQQSNKIIHKQSLIKGEVSWDSENLIKIVQELGNPTKEAPNGFKISYFNVSNGAVLNQRPEKK